MTDQIAFDPAAFDIKAFKQEAHERRKLAPPGTQHCHIIEQMAREHGFRTYASLRAAIDEARRTTTIAPAETP